MHELYNAIYSFSEKFNKKVPTLVDATYIS